MIYLHQEEGGDTTKAVIDNSEELAKKVSILDKKYCSPLEF